ncbi:hypothetical protein J1N09_01425 [Aureitalea sp. L0-47]|uniref:hypothetical protein n=1 Tax=Aureitalea sp. L0-47 TaxID=2816962 RepID=UPI002237F0E4|nr:hypothetical protein [Aureitalea sp. L0-47]MCW5518480.1 hypothetical protein [Aureitalea sp. L0-47]
MERLEETYTLEMEWLEAQQLVLYLEKTVHHIWATIPMKKFKMDKYKKKMASNADKIKRGKPNFFSNYEQSYLDAKGKVNGLKKEIYDLNYQKEMLNKLYLRLGLMFYSSSKLMRNATEENYERWNKNLDWRDISS